MGALADIFAAVRLQLDGTGFEAQATALADKSGKSVGDRMSQNLSASWKKAAASGLGGFLGGLGGAASSQGAELDRVAQNVISDMGLVGKEAANAKTAIAHVYEDNILGMEQIGATMEKVHNDLGLTGQAAEAATEKFAKYETATNQGAEAVSAFDDILDAWNLKTSDAGTIMDKLIVSHQKYGGAIADSQLALKEMAPALQAANMSIDDGIALLNLFNASGIEAAKAPQALAKAVAQLKPGQSLNDLIAQIGSIEDPTLRAQKAMDIFGSRAGAQMAQALKPGMSSLKDITASLGDTTDATAKAADASLSWGDRFTLAVHKIGGTLGEFGQNFGPLLIVASQLGPKLTAAVTTGLGSLAGMLLPKIAEQLGLTLPAWLGGGTAAGAAEVGAQAAAVAAGGAEVAAGVAAQTPEVAAAAAAGGTAAGEAQAAGMAAGFGGKVAALAAAGAFIIPVALVLGGAKDTADKMSDHIKAAQDAILAGDVARMEALREELAKIKPTVFGGPSTVEWKGAVDAIALLDAAIAKSTDGVATWDRGWETAATGIKGALTGATSGVGTAALGLANAATRPITDHMATAKTSVLDTLSTIAQTYRDKWSDLISIANDAAAAIFGPQTRASALAANQREQAAQREIIASHSATKAEKDDAKARLLALQQEGLGIRIEMAGRGELTGKAYDALISDLHKQAKSGNQEVANAAKLALAELAKLKAAWNALPPVLRSKYNDKGRYGGGPVQMGQSYTVNEQRLGGLGEIFVAPLDGQVISHADSMAAIAAGAAASGPSSVTYNIPVTVQGLVKARNPLEIAQEARRYARLGTFALPTAAPEAAG